MWCEKCEIVVNNDICPFCQKKTRGAVPTEIFWCDFCQAPIIYEKNDANKLMCHDCGNRVNPMTKDIRPVFAEERLLLGLIVEDPWKYMLANIWCSDSRYFVDGKSTKIGLNKLKEKQPREIASKITDLKESEVFLKAETAVKNQFEKFVKINSERFNQIENEAHQFIIEARAGYSDEQIVVSFSGGKDSTVVSDLTIKAIGNASLVHIFGDTTLEFPHTIDYKNKFREENTNIILRQAKNKEKDFYSVCDEIGPPARMMRWCCTMFKTGPISRVLSSMYKNQKVLTFYGIRADESASRSKYDRIYESPKITRQRVAAPIFNWSDAEVWLYILKTKILFNDAYRLGYDRVGCWCCPNNSDRSHLLSSVYLADMSEQWHNYLVEFAKKIGKPDPEVYVDQGGWKARQGGYGLESAVNIKVKFENCTIDEHARIYRINRPMNDEFTNLFVPFGKISPELGRKALNEVIIVDTQFNTPIISIHPYNQGDYEYAVRIQTMNTKHHIELQRKIAYQVRKYNSCKQCLGCEAICNFRAITIVDGVYKIDPQRCVHCGKCITEKHLTGGCLMSKYLYVSNGEN